MKNFVALDVETANERFSSICSVGAVRFEGGLPIDDFYELIDPRAEFSGMNSAIHGIRESDVRGAPTFDRVLPRLNSFVRGLPVAHHTHFDKSAVHQAASESSVAPPNWTWLDSAKITRRAWPKLARRGYGLADVCHMIGYEFDHHNALADARACGEVVLAASRELPDVDLREFASQPLGQVFWTSDGTRTQQTPEPAEDGPLLGETIVFTGALALPRRDAAIVAAQLGCKVAQGVTKKTTLLLVGDIDVGKLAGHEKSRKQRRAEELIASGQNIRILAESDFLAFAASEQG